MQTEIVDVEERSLAVVRKRVPMKDMGKAQREARALLAETLAAANVQPDARAVTVWRSPEQGMIDYAPGRFISGPVNLSGEVSLFKLPRGKAAHLRLTGSYEKLPEAWASLFQACKSRGLELSGLHWEIYAPAETPEEKMETDLYALLA